LHLLGVVQVLYKPKSINEQSRFTHQLQQVFDTIVSVHSADRECYSESDVDRVDYNACQVGQSTFAAAPLAIALGASTGGPVAISEVVRHFNSNSPPILIAQHISSRFSKTMVQGLQRLTDMKVTIAKPGTQITRGRVYIAPPEHHMEVDAGGRVKILNTVAADKFAPSVNLLFNSLSRSRLTSVIAVLMTGMGDDGAEGLLRLRKVGATTIAEHQSTCVVYGMPARAVEIGAALEVLPLPAIGPRILEHVAEFNAKKNRNRNLRLRFARTNSMD
jgi:chemotaxis response regulator CheB